MAKFVNAAFSHPRRKFLDVPPARAEEAADGAMKERLEKEEKAAAAAAVRSQKKSRPKGPAKSGAETLQTQKMQR